MNRFLENKETDALFALPEKGESEDDVDTLPVSYTHLTLPTNSRV